jgi:hypothetical protein
MLNIVTTYDDNNKISEILFFFFILLQYFIFLMLQVNFITFIDLFIVSTSIQGARGRKSPATSIQGDGGKAPAVPQ